MKRVMLYDDANLPRLSQAGDGIFDNIKPTALATVGAGTLLAGLLTSGMLLRTGPTGAYADTIDTGANLDTAFPNMKVGDSIGLYYVNSVAFASTITAATGVTLGSATANNVIAASTGRRLHLVKTGTATYVLYVI